MDTNFPGINFDNDFDDEELEEYEQSQEEDGSEDYYYNDDNDSGDAGATELTSESKGRNFPKLTLKFVAGAIAVIIIIAALVSWGIRQIISSGNSRNNSSGASQSERVEPSGNSNEQQSVASQRVQSNPSGINGWTNIPVAEVSFGAEMVPANFTVIKINHFVKVANSNNDIEIFTILSGKLDFVDGSFDLMVPYSKGQHLVIGNSFNVEVEVGEYGGKTVIGEISF
jgi:hypothetical protein